MYEVSYDIGKYKVVRKVEHLEYLYILAQKGDSQFFSISRYLRDDRNSDPLPYSVQKITAQDAQQLQQLDKMEFINLISKLHVNPHKIKRR